MSLKKQDIPNPKEEEINTKENNDPNQEKVPETDKDKGKEAKLEEPPSKEEKPKESNEEKGKLLDDFFNKFDFKDESQINTWKESLLQGKKTNKELSDEMKSKKDDIHCENKDIDELFDKLNKSEGESEEKKNNVPEKEKFCPYCGRPFPVEMKDYTTYKYGYSFANPNSYISPYRPTSLYQPYSYQKYNTNYTRPCSYLNIENPSYERSERYEPSSPTRYYLNYPNYSRPEYSKPTYYYSSAYPTSSEIPRYIPRYTAQKMESYERARSPPGQPYYSYYFDSNISK